VYASDQNRHAGYDTATLRAGWMGTLLPQIQEKQLCLCPSAPIRQPAPQRGLVVGTADSAWLRWTEDNKTMFSSSYGYNGWLYSDMLVKTAGGEDKDYSTLVGVKLRDTLRPEYIFTRENSIQQPARTPVFVDANWVDLWPLETDVPSTDLYNGLSLGVNHDYMGRCTISRHGPGGPARAPRRTAIMQKPSGAINMGAADGHAELVKLENLWTYCWHHDWQPPSIRW
jgi:hypothetical protein